MSRWESLLKISPFAENILLHDFYYVYNSESVWEGKNAIYTIFFCFSLDACKISSSVDRWHFSSGSFLLGQLCVNWLDALSAYIFVVSYIFQLI